MDSPPRGVVPASFGQGTALAALLSEEHRREIADTAGTSAEAAIALSLAASLEAYAFIPHGDAPVFMMGVEATGVMTGSAMLWMLATADIRRHAAATMRAARWGVRRAFAVGGAERLEQYIPEWYAIGLRFAGRLGFTIDPARCPGPGGTPLLRVVLERKDIAWER